MMKTASAVALLLGWTLLCVPIVAADKPTPPPPPDDPNATDVVTRHPGPVPDTRPRRARMSVAESKSNKARPTPSGPLSGVKAVALKDGEALLQLGEEQRTVHPGDLIGTAVVQLIGDGTLVLERPEIPGQPGGVATIVVRFDAQGRSTVSVFHASDPAPLRVPEVAR